MQLTSTPSQPTEIRRDVGTLSFRLDATGLVISESLGPDALRFDIDEVLALRDFLRTPGVSALLSRAWLASEHARVIGEQADEGADDDNRQKRFAGRKAA